MLVLAAGSATWAQSAPPETIFPTDNQDLRQAGAVELPESVCPGQVATGNGVECRSGCPAYTFGKGGRWSVGAVFRGHFVSAVSDDAILDMDGCEPHVNEYGGTILLTRGVPGWRLPKWKNAVVHRGRPDQPVPRSDSARPAGRSAKTSRTAFRFDGHEYKPAPSSAEAVRLFKCP
ncbi:MAG TPA: hypothetical protein VME43_27145 [Bryobacteraceae bacterium]|nr:hypothetical protein [Bryobacteraceae bacterium]